MIKCKIDGLEFKNGGVLARHLKNKHALTFQDYYHKYIIKTADIPKCKCGCKTDLEWTHVGYKVYVKGHYSRVHNNWGHNIIAIEKSAATRRQQFKSGERKIWNDGLTIDDERVKINSERSTDTINSNPIEIKRRSDSMRENRLNGTIPTLYGSDSSRWKGGTSEINNIARSDKRLYEEWKYPILLRDGFKCNECKSPKRLHVHHDKERMCEIVKKHIVDEEHVNNFELKKCIASKIVDYHIKNNVSGITLCGECHEKYHPSLNFA